MITAVFTLLITNCEAASPFTDYCMKVQKKSQLAKVQQTLSINSPAIAGVNDRFAPPASCNLFPFFRTSLSSI